MIKRFWASLPKFGKDKTSTALHQLKVYMVGYPKTGSTWLRVMLGKYVQLLLGRDRKSPLPLFEKFEELDPRVPLIEFTHGNLEWSRQVAADLTLENAVFPFCQSQVVLLVRSIPDVLVSLYWQEKTRNEPPYPGTISDFIRDPVFGVEKVIAFYRLWYEGRNRANALLLLRYEDLYYGTELEFKKLLKFLKIPLDAQHLEDAIAYSKFENMRKLEVNNMKSSELVYQSSGYSIFATGDVEKTKEAFHVRKGQIGGFREYLSKSDIEFLNDSMKDNVPDWYGYQNGFWKETL
jgi:hypothetical protein